MHTIGNGAEIVVVHLLVLGGIVTHQGTACQKQVRTCGIESFVHKEILLFPSEVRGYLLHVGIEILTYFRSGHIHSMEGAQQGSLVVEGLTAIRDEDGGNTECVVDDEDRRSGVPGRIAAGLESGTDTTTWERGSVGLLLNEQLAAELFHHAALAIVLDKGVVLFSSTFRQRLEPVGVMGNAILHGPLFHTSSYSIGHIALQTGSIINDINHFLINLLGQILVHLLAVEHFLTEVLIRPFGRCYYVERLLLECLANNLKS